MASERRRARAGSRKTAVAYLRVSTDEQALGPEAQRAAILVYAARSGLTVASWHEDLGVSGAADIDACPGLLRALDAIGESGAGVLLVAKRDRLARDVIKAALIERLAERRGASIVSAAGEGNGDSPTDKLMRRITDSFGEYERLLIKARTRAALGVKRDRGERISRIAPYGYMHVDGQVVPDLAEQAAIARAKELRTRGMTLAAIIAELEVEGLMNRAGRRFGLAALHKMVGGTPTASTA